MKILAIETSCDETGVAILEGTLENGSIRRAQHELCFRILSNMLATQIKVHKKWGGVVPNLAARAHQKNLVPTLKMALKEANALHKIKNQKSKIKNTNQKLKILNRILEREPILLSKTEAFLIRYGIPEIDLITVTHGPGLAPALWAGVNFAKALAYWWRKPIIPVNHLEGHIFSNFINESEKFETLAYPVLCLVVSGGHTQLVLMNGLGKYKIIGETLDDAAGEAFDKVAKMLNLGFPGGPIVSKLAAKGNPSIFKFPRPMLNQANFDFSFSGLKTAVLYKIKNQNAKIKMTKQNPKLSKKEIRDLCASFEQAVVDVLVAKTIRAAHKYGVKHVLLAGGVAANSKLREALAQKVKTHLPHAVFWQPPLQYSTDNGAMIASAAYFRYDDNPKITTTWKKIEADANLRF